MSLSFTLDSYVMKTVVGLQLCRLPKSHGYCVLCSFQRKKTKNLAPISALSRLFLVCHFGIWIAEGELKVGVDFLWLLTLHLVLRGNLFLDCLLGNKLHFLCLFYHFFRLKNMFRSHEVEDT